MLDLKIQFFILTLRIKCYNIIKAKEYQKFQYDTNKANPIELEVGMLVLIQNEQVRLGSSKKLTCPWLGPYRVTRIKDNVNIEVELNK